VSHSRFDVLQKLEDPEKMQKALKEKLSHMIDHFCRRRCKPGDPCGTTAPRKHHLDLESKYVAQAIPKIRKVTENLIKLVPHLCHNHNTSMNEYCHSSIHSQIGKENQYTKNWELLAHLFGLKKMVGMVATNSLLHSYFNMIPSETSILRSRNDDEMKMKKSKKSKSEIEKKRSAKKRKLKNDRKMKPQPEYITDKTKKTLDNINEPEKTMTECDASAMGPLGVMNLSENCINEFIQN